MRAVSAAVLSAVLLIGLPLVGGVSGGWAAVHFTDAALQPEPEPEAAEREQCGMGELARVFFNMVLTGLAGFGGLLAGVAVGLAVAFPAVNVLSEWSANGSPIDDEMDEWYG